MEVTAVQRQPQRPASTLPSTELVIVPPTALSDLLPETQALLICLPHTPQTAGLIGARELSLLPPSAIVVNVGRGAVVDEAALYSALSTSNLFAAGLDVWYTYPETEDSRTRTAPSSLPFHELDNVVMSPHRAGATDETDRLRAQHLAKLLNAAAGGGPMPNRVDLELGY
jgi:phosphoglycerate dehydrogenase-like enzyme